MIETLFDLSGRVAIVTGGSRGLGAEFAEGLAEAGASVMLCARRDEWLAPGLESLRGRGFEAEAMRCDVSNAADVEAVVRATVERFGKIDILVNNAGVSWGERPETMMLAQWQKVVDVNLTGAFICSQAAGREMLTRHYGRIINIASIAGMQGNVNGPYYAAYAASKAGLMGLTRELASSWGPQGIRVECDCSRIFPLAHVRLVNRAGRIEHQGDDTTRPRWPPWRTERRRRLSRVGCLELHHRSDDCRRWRRHNRHGTRAFVTCDS